jgi:hypothetical protein
MKRVSIILLFSLSQLFLYSQYSYYKRALITKNNSSIISGYVEKVSESSISFGVKFKNSIDSKDVQNISVSDIKQILFLDDSSVFQRVKYAHFKNFADMVKTVEYRLAKLMLTGYADLYKLQLPQDEWHIIIEQNNTFAYIVKIDTNYFVLDQKEILDEANYKLNKNYVGVLNYLLRNENKIKDKVKDLKFNDKEMVKLFTELNSEHSNNPSKQLAVKEKLIFNHGPAFGFGKFDNFEGIYKSNYGEEKYSIEGLHGFAYHIDYTFSFCSPEISEHLFYNAGLSYVRLDFINIPNFKFNKNLFKIPLSVNYNFTKNKISPFLGIGITPTFYYKLFGDFYINATAGAVLYQKCFIAFSVENKTLSFFNTGRFYFLNLGYIFKTKK